jgi:hypothetical protein
MCVVATDRGVASANHRNRSPAPLTEREKGRIRFELKAGDKTIASASTPIEILAYNYAMRGQAALL